MLGIQPRLEIWSLGSDVQDARWCKKVGICHVGTCFHHVIQFFFRDSVELCRASNFPSNAQGSAKTVVALVLRKPAKLSRGRRLVSMKPCQYGRRMFKPTAVAMAPGMDGPSQRTQQQRLYRVRTLVQVLIRH